ncbi:hypothetical protein VKT23_008339 [Stygiomarasmius scandens]|uniref:Crinkler (CRN) family protein n=1 Tax=Marasmiellus scandens TaxID=2682957 RepID=A0ABR1JKP6_9AGAR
MKYDDFTTTLDHDDPFQLMHKHFWCKNQLFSNSRIEFPPGSLMSCGMIVPRNNTIYAREEYDILWNRLLLLERRRGFIVTGSPGIGKSIFCLYALVRRLGQGRTTIFRTSSKNFYLFDQRGAFQLSLSLSNPARNFEAWRLGQDIVWCLYDTAVTDSNPESQFFTSSVCFLVQAVSPNPAKTKWGKQIGAQPYYMNAWAKEELCAVFALHDENAADEDKVNYTEGDYEKYGPCLRDHLYRPLFVADAQNAIREIRDAAQLAEQIDNASKETISNPEKTPHRIFCCIRDTDEDDGYKCKVDFKTQSIMYQCFERCVELKAEQATALFDACRLCAKGSVLGGWIFERLAILCTSGQAPGFEARIGIFRQLGEKETEGKGMKKGSKAKGEGSRLFSQLLPESKSPIKTRPLRRYRGIDDIIIDDHYYYPVSRSQPLFDTIFFDAAEDKVVVWVLQITTSHDRHSSSETGCALLAEIMKKARESTKKGQVEFNYMLVMPSNKSSTVGWQFPPDESDKFEVNDSSSTSKRRKVSGVKWIPGKVHAQFLKFEDPAATPSVVTGKGV